MHRHPVVSIWNSRTVLDADAEAPRVASFSPRGPNLLTPGILKVVPHYLTVVRVFSVTNLILKKMLIWMCCVGVEQPDISAPGVGILAAWSPHVAVSITANDDRRVPYNIVSGTSVANPHVTGAAAYVKAAHPDWSPAAVISSLVTSGSSLIQLTTASYIFTSTQVGFFLWHRLLIGH
jgi:subtilisin family serine protease